MKKNSKKGFSLIELLVVIAIIGILSSVTLATLNVARGKGADAAIKANLDTIRKQVAVYYDENGGYGDDTVDCFSGLFLDATIARALSQATSTGGGAAVCVSDDGDVAAGTATSWAVAVPLKTDPTQSWCIDGAEFVGIGTAAISAGNIAECN